MKRASMGAGSGNGEEEDLEKKGERERERESGVEMTRTIRFLLSPSLSCLVME